MITCRVEQHINASTIKHICLNCGKGNVRCFGNNLKEEHSTKTCWECSTEQPAFLNLVRNRMDRIEYHKTSIIPKPKSYIPSGLY
jgi:hypothetical protein